MQAAVYSLKYTTKTESEAALVPILQIGYELARCRRLRDGDGQLSSDEAQKLGIKRLRQACHAATGAQTYPAPMAALYLLHGKDALESHGTVMVVASTFVGGLLTDRQVRHVQRVFRVFVELPPIHVYMQILHAAEETAPSTVLVRSQMGGLLFATALTTYTSRPSDLDALSPVVLAMFYTVQAKDAVFAKSVMDGMHPLSVVECATPYSSVMCSTRR
jgi:hypothetical protein